MQRESFFKNIIKAVGGILSAVAALICLFYIASVPKNGEIYNSELQNTLNVDKIISSKASEDESVYLGGYPIGISICANGLIVLGTSEVKTKEGDVFPLKDADVQAGDILMSVNGESVNSIYQLKLLLKDVKGEVKLKFCRIDREYEVSATPAYDVANMGMRLGLVLKEDVGGVGTMTFVTKGGAFAALGHYISDGETGVCEELVTGKIFKADVEGVIKGTKGKAGGLIADVNRLADPIGLIKENSLIGIYGVSLEKGKGELVKVAREGEAHIGPAKVLTTISGEAKLFDIDVVKVISQGSPQEKGMVVKVSDRELLNATGGIVQGMSGSPILQNGKLIGAITHVLIQDPTRGYAVHAGFMLENALRFEDTVSNEPLSRVEYSVMAA